MADAKGSQAEQVVRAPEEGTSVEVSGGVEVVVGWGLLVS